MSSDLITYMTKWFSGFFIMTFEEYNQLNPPTVWVKYDDDLQMPFRNLISDNDWLDIGYIPMPRNRIEWFVYHMVHGIAMRYPFQKAFFYACLHTDPQKPGSLFFKMKNHVN